MFYEVLMEKRAVSLKDLRKAYKAKVGKHLVRTTRSERKALRRQAGSNNFHAGLAKARRGSSAAVAVPKSGIDDVFVDTFHGLGSQYDVNRIKEKARETLDPDSFILMGGDTGRTLSDLKATLGVEIPKAKTPQGREAFNRTMGLHEAREMKAMKNSPSQMARGGPSFYSHFGVQPMINDVIIANTYKGKGAKDLRASVAAMRNRELSGLKEMLKTDPKSVSLVEKLEAGGRINRHGRKHLDKQYSNILKTRGLS